MIFYTYETNAVIIERDNKYNTCEIYFKPNKHGEVAKLMYKALKGEIDGKVYRKSLQELCK